MYTFSSVWLWYFSIVGEPLKACQAAGISSRVASHGTLLAAQVPRNFCVPELNRKVKT